MIRHIPSIKKHGRIKLALRIFETVSTHSYSTPGKLITYTYLSKDFHLNVDIKYHGKHRYHQHHNRQPNRDGGWGIVLAPLPSPENEYFQVRQLFPMQFNAWLKLLRLPPACGAPKGGLKSRFHSGFSDKWRPDIAWNSCSRQVYPITLDARLIFHAITQLFLPNSRFHAMKYVQSRHHVFPLGGPFDGVRSMFWDFRQI